MITEPLVNESNFRDAAAALVDMESRADDFIGKLARGPVDFTFLDQYIVLLNTGELLEFVKDVADKVERMAA